MTVSYFPRPLHEAVHRLRPRNLAAVPVLVFENRVFLESINQKLEAILSELFHVSFLSKCK